MAVFNKSIFGLQGGSGFSGISGFSGWSGADIGPNYSGWSGKSGWSGISGYSGVISEGVYVADATAGTIVTQFNLLLTSLKDANIIASS